MDLKLSQYPKRNCIYFTVKNSQGMMKRLKLGAEVVESKKFTLILNPYVMVERFRLEKSRNDGIVLVQDADGPINLTISSDITLIGDSKEPPNNYFFSEFRQKEDGKWVVHGLYIPL